MRDSEKSIERRRADIRKIEEELIKARKETERLSAKAKTLAVNSTASSSTREAQLQSEVDKCMVRAVIFRSFCHAADLFTPQSILKCSTCKMNMRNTVITKCMHCM